MKDIVVEVIGVEPPCKRCQAMLRNVEEAASILQAEGIYVKISKLDVQARDTIMKYGVLVSPALAINNVVKVMGRVPDRREIEKIIRASAE